ncbi:MAG: hypothetical protein AMXMBFR23_03420 [Chloroflexota bacterium]
MPTITWAGVRVDEGLARKVDAAADAHAVPRNVVRAIVLAESAGRADVIAHEAAATRGGYSVGLLQLYDFGQGAGMSVAERQDPDRNLAVGVPHIARAWQATTHLTGAERVRRTAALSGHPADPTVMAHGTPRVQAERAIERIVDLWRTLEGEAPDAVPVAFAGVVPFMDGPQVQRLAEQGAGWVQAHPLVAAGAALALAALIAL